MNLEIGIAGEFLNQVIDRAGREGHRASTLLAEQVMAVAGRAPNVGGRAIRLDDPGQHINRSEDFQGAIDRGAANPGTIVSGAEFGHELFS